MIEDKYPFKLYLIYTQPDIIIETNQLKDNQIKKLEKKIIELREEMENFHKFHFNYINYDLKFCEIDKEVIEFCKKMDNEKSLLTIGILDKINEKHKYNFSSLNSVDSLLALNLEKNFYLIDFKTFNYVNINSFDNNKYLCDNTAKIYKDKIEYCTLFNEVYLLVDYVFMKNLSIIIEKIISQYIIKIYMFEKSYFMLYLKKENLITIPEIQFIKNLCKNPMLEDSQNVDINEVEEFISNYYDLLSKKNDFLKKEINNEFNDIFYLFDFKGTINYIINCICKPSIIKDVENKFFIEIDSVKKEFNIYYDILKEKLTDNIKHQNIIFVRKTEFGLNYEVKKIKLIINYIFGITDLEIIDNTLNNNNKLTVFNTGTKYGEDCFLTKIIEKNHCLPILQFSNLEINPNLISLFEYLYFLLLPLLISKKENNPKILILANDFGIMNYYFSKLYPNEFDISSFMETKEFMNDKQIKIDYNSINIKDFSDVYKNQVKKNNKYDLILLEYFRAKSQKDTSIPNGKLKWGKILEKNGIFAFNLRSNSFSNYEKVLNSIKKEYNIIKEINFRACSGLIICRYNISTKIEKNYLPIMYENIIGRDNFDEDFENSKVC